MTEPDFDLQDAAELLIKHGFKVSSPAPPRPPRTCMVCGHTEESYNDEYMVDVRVEVARGEEGHADILKYVCIDSEDRCLAKVQDALTFAGFNDHRHGGINFLEDETCPGAQRPSQCPTPAPEDD